MGEIAKLQGYFDNAIAYFKKAFEIRVNAKHWHKAAETLVRWGETLEAQGNQVEALSKYIQVFAIDIKHNHDEIGFQAWINSDIKNLGRMLKVLGERQFEVVWREVTSEECEENLRSAIQAASEENEECYGSSIKY